MTVIEADTKRPVYNASVDFGETQESIIQQIRDANGAITFVMPPGTYVIKAVAEPNHMYLRTNQSVTVRAGETKAIQLEMPAWPTITGTIKYGGGKSAEKIWVQIMPGDREAVLTDASGYYSVTYNPQIWGYRPRPQMTVIARNPKCNLAGVADVPHDSNKVDITFASAIKVTGKVTDPNGKPISGANVIAYLFKNRNSVRITNRGEYKTDANGIYCIPALPVGEKNSVLAFADGYGSNQNNVTSLSAGMVTLKPVVLEPAIMHISGIVVNSKAIPVKGARISVRGVNQHSNPDVFSDQNGKFHIDKLVSGEVQVDANFNSADEHFHGSVFARVGDEHVRIEIK